MANMELIGGPTGGQISSAQSSITFSNIPQTYTDLVLKVSARTTFSSTSDFNIEPNGSSANLTGKRIYGTGTSVLSDSATWELTNGTDTTSNTFINTEVYFPNYASSNYKSFSSDGVMENNATFAYSYVMSHLWANNTPISSLTIRSGAGNFVAGSTFYLYGISNVTSTTKATGGIVSSDGTYWYHMFPYSSTFTPTQSLTADYLVIAGGGGAGQAPGSSGTYASGAGGAGGLRSTVDATGRNGTLESTLSLTAQAYTVTVGAGGAAGSTPGSTNGGNSVFSTITSLGGGAGYYSTANAGNNGIGNGGSGGAGGANYFGLGTAGQGYDGGSGNAGSIISGSGGGAGAIGVFDSNGGNGLQIPTMANATGTGINSYYAGGGAAGSGTVRIGGLGGGGNQNSSGVANTGGGGGGKQGSGNSSSSSGAGGSGIVIIRYAI